MKKVLLGLLIVLSALAFFVGCSMNIEDSSNNANVHVLGEKKTLIDIEVILNEDILYEGDDIKDYLTVKGLYFDGVKTIYKHGYSTNLLDDKVTLTTNSVTVTYIDGEITKEKTLAIILGDLSDYLFDDTELSEDYTSVSFVKEKPTDETELIKTDGKLSYYKKGTDFYVVGDRKIILPSNCLYLFNTCSIVEKIDFSHVDTSMVTNMRRMFYRCTKLKSLDLSKFDISNVTDWSDMFGHCDGLTSVKINPTSSNKEKFDTVLNGWHYDNINTYTKY